MWSSQRVVTAGWRYRTPVTVFAPAAAVTERIGPYAGIASPAPVGESGEACVLDTCAAGDCDRPLHITDDRGHSGFRQST